MFSFMHHLNKRLYEYKKLYQYRPRLNSRCFHAYCVGTPKSGTASIANLLQKNFRSAHEPRTRQTIEHLSNHLLNKDEGQDFASLSTYLRARDKYLWLELEAAHVLHHCIGMLVDIFPNAKFILTIRDCFSWLNSEINQQYMMRKFPHWTCIQRIRYQYGEWNFVEEDQILSQYDLYPIASYLSYWTRHNKKVLSAVPSSRLLVIRTQEIDNHLPAMAQFLDISHEEIDQANSHSHQRKSKALNVFELVPSSYIEQQAETYCCELMDQFFPDTSVPTS